MIRGNIRKRRNRRVQVHFPIRHRSDKSFSQSDNLKRHIKNVHEKMTPEIPVHHPKFMHYQDGSCIAVVLPKLIHPFTCLVAGLTGSVKTLFLKNVLELKNHEIYQCPQRIVWCYS